MKQLNVIKYNLITVAIILLSLNVFAQNGAWTRKANIPKSGGTASVVNNKIYVFGGSTPGSFTDVSSAEMYDPVTDTWTEKLSMPTARGFLTSAVVDNKIYVIGGGYPTPKKTLEVYDPTTDSWSKKADMPDARLGMRAAVVDGIIYIFGGNYDQRDCYSYDPKTDRWTKKESIPEGTGGALSVTSYNGLIYVFAGSAANWVPLQKVFAYDPKTNTYTEKSKIPTKRFAFQTHLVNGKIYALGGSQYNGGAISTVEVYNPGSNTWETKPNMPYDNAWFSGAVINDKIYLITGTSDWSKVKNDVWEYDPSFHTKIIGGNVSSTWALSKSPYHINGEITIPNDSTLTIEPGVEVVFMGHYKFNVQGRLLAVGTKKDSIRFIAEDTVKGWHGIRFSQTPGTNDTSKFAYCSFKYGKANTGDYSSLDRCGGAIFVNKFNKVLITNCLFKFNMNNGDGSNTGGAAIFLSEASPVIINSTFSNNQGTTDGAIASAYPSSSIISNNTILHNSGVWGTIMSYGSDNKPTISNNIISYNIVTGGAGGIIIMEDARPTVENNVITYNRAISKSLTYAGGISCYNNVKPLITNNIIAFNSADLGGGIVFLEQGNATLINNTIVNNIASAGGGIYCGNYGGGGNSDPVMVNNIIYGNLANNGSQAFIQDVSSDPVFQYNDIQAGKDGFGGGGAGANYNGLYENNIDTDPQFVNVMYGEPNNDYSLSNSSPCLGRGINSTKIAGVVYKVPPFCIMGNSRPSPAGTNPDIGACESLLGQIPSVVEEMITPTKFALYQNYPNPFNPSTVISYQLPAAGFVSLKIFDLLGNEIATLVNEEKPAGEFAVTWNAKNYSSGVYFYQLKTKHFIETKKMLLMK